VFLRTWLFEERLTRKKLARLRENYRNGYTPFDWNAGVQQRERARAHSRHGRRTVAFCDGAFEAAHKRKFILARDDGRERSLRQVTVSDFATGSATGTSSLSNRGRRKEVVKHEALVFTGFDVVLTLCVLLTTKSRDADGLRFPASKERAAVRARENASFAGDRTNHARRATILSATLVTNGVAKSARLNLTASIDDGVRLQNVCKTKYGAESVSVKRAHQRLLRNLECVQRAGPEVLGCDAKVGWSPVRSIHVNVCARS